MKSAPTLDGTADGRTRQRVVHRLAHGPATAADLAGHVGVSPTAVRRHLDALVADGEIEAIDRRPVGPRTPQRGRPARAYALTGTGRTRAHGHHYDDLASAALHHLARFGGEDAVRAFAEERVAVLEDRCRTATEAAGDDPAARADALAGALSAEGYAASASTVAGGDQLCQHHCPVAQVATEFPQLCDAETRVISRLVGTHVQRLATIAHGDGVCTTFIPALPGGQQR